MARDLNQVMLLGRLTADPELRQTPSGRSVCSFAIATNDSYKDAAGVTQEKVEFTDIVAWGRPGEIIAQYVKKGEQLFVSGRLQTRTWQAQDGTNRRTTEVVLRDFQLISGRGGGGGGAPRAADPGDGFDQSAPADPLEGTDGAADSGKKMDVKDLPF